MDKFNPFEKFKFTFDTEGWFQDCLIPKKVATCPCCQSRLVAHAEGWYQDDKGNWFADEIKVDCIRDENNLQCYKEFENSDYWRMPYVYWLPVEECCKSWVHSMLEIYHGIEPIPMRWLERNGQQNLFGKTYEKENLFCQKANADRRAKS